MKKKVMKKWVEALRSGKYEQGTAFLNSENRFCCLGVLCELALKEKVCKKKYSYNGNANYGNIDGEWLPKSVMKWAGIKSKTGEAKGESKDLTHYNDSGHDFQTMADIIEFNYKDL